MDLNLDTITILHNERAHRFEATVNGLLSRITYIRSGDSIIFNHTEVPPPLEGRGLAARLTRTALEFARANHLRVVPQCPYVSHFLRKHPEFQDLVQPS